MIDKYLNEILLICASVFDISIENIQSKSRKQEIVYCRKAFCIVVKEKLDLKNEFIAKKLNCTKSAVSSFINNQPNNNFYRFCLIQIRGKLNEKA